MSNDIERQLIEIVESAIVEFQEIGNFDSEYNRLPGIYREKLTAIERALAQQGEAVAWLAEREKQRMLTLQGKIGKTLAAKYSCPLVKAGTATGGVPEGLNDLVRWCRKIGWPLASKDSLRAVENMQSALARVESALLTAAPSPEQGQAPCKGESCGSTNPNLHSAECFAEHEACVGGYQAAAGSGWIRCSERLPTEADIDARTYPFNQVWVQDSEGDIYTVHWAKASDYFRWMPTGLKRPNPPAEGE